MKKVLSLFIALILIMSSATVSIGQSNDYESSWAKNEINYMKEKGILSGYPDGTFRPANNMSKAEFYKVINGLMGFVNKAEVKFDDVSSTDWYYTEVQKGLGANYILPGTSLNAKENITRGEVARIIGIVFDIEEDEVAAEKFTDTLTLPKELKGFIGGLMKNGYINGYSDGTFRPEANITRAEVVKMIHNISGEIVNIAGDVSKNIKTNLVVNTADVVLKDMTIEGNLYLTEGIGEGDVTLDNVIVKGKLSIKGGGANSIIIKNSKINIVLVDKEDKLVRIVLENTTVEEVKTVNEVKLVLTDGTEVKIMELDGKIEVVVEKGSAIVNFNATSNEITIDSKGTIKSIKSAKEIKVNGTTLKANTEYKMEDGKTTESKPTPAPVTPAPSGGSSGGGGGGGSVTPTPVTLSTIAITTPANKLTYKVGEVLDVTGMVVTGTYSDGSTKVETITAANITGFDSSTEVASQVLTVTVGGKTVTYTVKIEEVKVPVDPVVNKAILSEKIETVTEAVYGKSYTPETFGPFEIALGTAIVVRDNAESTQDQVDDALVNLSQRFNALILVGEEPEPVEVDKTALVIAIATANAKAESDYTPETWGPFAAALIAATGVNDNGAATQIEVDEALTTLTNTMSALVLKVVDPDPIEADLTAYNLALAAVVEDDYTVESWTAYQEIVIANMVTSSNTQEEVDIATASIIAAQTSLVRIDITIANVSNLAELKLALADTTKTIINIKANIETTGKLLVSRPVTINGENNIISFTGDEEGWKGNYVLHIYKTEATISNLKLTGGDAGLLVNGSTVVLTGTIDVGGNEFGGIEVSKGKNVNDTPLLTVIDARLVNGTEAYGLPTIWEDGVTETVVGFAGTKIVKGTQTQYYLVEANAANPEEAYTFGITLDKDIYTMDEYITLSGTVKRNSVGLGDVDITFRIVDKELLPIDMGQLITDVNGEFSHRFQVPVDTEPGTYKMIVKANDPVNKTNELNFTMVAKPDPIPVVDKSVLAAAIATANTKVEEAYTPETWAPFSAALIAAIGVNDNGAATQIEVDAALSELNIRMSALVEKENPLPQPTITVEVRNSSPMLPMMLQLKVAVGDIPNAAKYDVVYQLSGGGGSNTAKYNLGTWTTESIFFNPQTITDKIIVRIYDATGDMLLHTFTNVVIANPMIPK